MKKDLIIIGAYCPDEERLKLLYNCIESLSPIKKDFDFLLTTHSSIPNYITEKFDYVFFDKKNQLITDWELINKPWFSPFENYTIISALVSGYSTFLAVYRIFIGALGIAKNFKYEKIHWVEYDSVFNEFGEFYDNSKLLEENTAIVYKKEYKNFEKNLEWGYGCFQSINIKKLDDIFLTYDEEKLTNILKNCPNKTNEKTTQEVYQLNGGKVYFKDFNKLSESNDFNLSDNTIKEDLNYWTLPFYDYSKESVSVVVWNDKNDTPIDVVFLINKETILTFNSVKKFEWSIKEIGKIEEIETITTIINGKIKNNLIFNNELRELFKKTSYVSYS